MRAQIRRARCALRCVPRGGRFLLPDVGRQRGKAHAGVNAAVRPKHGRAQPRQAKAAAVKRLAVFALAPAHRRADATLLARHHLLQARQAVGEGVLAHLDADPAPTHLVRHGGGGAGAEKAVEDEVAGVGGDIQNLCEKPFGLWCREQVGTNIEILLLTLRLAVVACLKQICPKRRGRKAFHFVEIGPPLYARHIFIEPNLTGRQLLLHRCWLPSPTVRRGLNTIAIRCRQYIFQVFTGLRRVERISVKPWATRIVIVIPEVRALFYCVLLDSEPARRS